MYIGIIVLKNMKYISGEKYEISYKSVLWRGTLRQLTKTIVSGLGFLNFLYEK